MHRTVIPHDVRQRRRHAARTLRDPGRGAVRAIRPVSRLGRRPGRGSRLAGVARVHGPGRPRPISRNAPCREVSFELWPGEVLGIAGVDGNGQKHLAEVLAGQRPVTPGADRPRPAPISPPRWGAGPPWRRGSAMSPTSGWARGRSGPFSVATNLVLKEIGKHLYWRRGLSDWDFDPRPCPRSDPPPRHPHPSRADAAGPALRRQYPEGAAGPRDRYRRRRRHLQQADLWPRSAEHCASPIDRIIASAQDRGLAHRSSSPPTSTSCWRSAIGSASCSRAGSPASWRTVRMWSEKGRDC